MLTKQETIDKAVMLVTATDQLVDESVLTSLIASFDEMNVEDLAIMIGALTGLCRAALDRLHTATGQDSNALLQEIALKARRQA